MKLSRAFKLSYYLSRNTRSFERLTAAIQNPQSLPCDESVRKTIARMLAKQKSDNYAKHPECLINIMTLPLSGNVACDLLVDMLKRQDPDFAVDHLEAHDLEGLLKYDKRAMNRNTFSKIMWAVTSADLERVKLLLSWKISEGYTTIGYGGIETVDGGDVAKQVISTHGPSAAFVMALIFTYMEQQNVVVQLASAIGLQHE